MSLEFYVLRRPHYLNFDLLQLHQIHQKVYSRRNADRIKYLSQLYTRFTHEFRYNFVHLIVYSGNPNSEAIIEAVNVFLFLDCPLLIFFAYLTDHIFEVYFVPIFIKNPFDSL